MKIKTNVRAGQGQNQKRGADNPPETVEVVYVPPDLTIDEAPIRYEARYVFDPASGVLQVSRRMQADFGKQVCSPMDFEAMRGTLVRIERDASAQVVVRADGGRAGVTRRRALKPRSVRLPDDFPARARSRAATGRAKRSAPAG